MTYPTEVPGVCLTGLALTIALTMSHVNLANQSDDSRVVLADGKIIMKASDQWQSKEPMFKGIVSYEFVIKAAPGDTANGRLTVGGASGGVEANVRRWMSQYTQPDGKATSERTVQKKITLKGQDVHYIDITGTYQGSQFFDEPSGPDYRLLGAFIETGSLGSYYLKFYGPNKTVAANEKAFKSMIDSLEIVE